MLRPILLRLCLFRNEAERRYSERVALDVLAVMVRANLAWLKMHPGDYPPLYRSGVRYLAEPDAQRFEDWKGTHQLYHDGAGDCEDLAAHRAAELLASDAERADMGSPVSVGCGLKRRARGRRNSYHVVVVLKYADGRTRIEDPSSRLGMYKADQVLTPLIQDAFESPGRGAEIDDVMSGDLEGAA